MRGLKGLVRINIECIAAMAGYFAVLPTTVAGQAPVPYDVVYVRQPRFGDEVNTTWPEVAHPTLMDAGADLVLLHPDGSEEVLVAGGVGAVTDPFVSFDAQWVYYAYFYDQVNINPQRGLTYAGSDIYRINLESREIEQLTHAGPEGPLPPGEFSPNSGAGTWYQTSDGAFQPNDVPAGYNYLGYGVFNLGPCPLPGGRLAFTSSRNAFMPPKALTQPTLQLFVMDEDGSNLTRIGPLSVGSALHPTPLADGRIMFSSSETQGVRDDRVWGLWSIYPDGRHWGPMLSAFMEGQSMHFMTQLSSGDIVVVNYYNLNNNGFGLLMRFPLHDPGSGLPGFSSAFDPPALPYTLEGGLPYSFSIPFSPLGIESMSPFTTWNDAPAPEGENGIRVGKFTHPSAGPDNSMLVVWTPGPAHDGVHASGVPFYDAGLYLVPGDLEGGIIASPADLILVKNDPAYNEAWPRAVVPYSDVHGVAEPAEIPWLPNDGTLHADLPAGTPYGLVGTSSFYKRESFPGIVSPWDNDFDGLDAFNTSENGQSSNWGIQGSDAGKYSDSEIWAVRLLAMEGGTHRSYGPDEGVFFTSHVNERLRILGEIPLRKFDQSGNAILDPEGNPDTSFLARIPADTPFTFQTIDKYGLVLNMAQTWHQVRPGEVRNDCGGCHAHSQVPLAFSETFAATPEYQPIDLTQTTPLITQDAEGNPSLTIVDEPLVNIEFQRDIRPLLQDHCAQCHTGSDETAPGLLVLDDTTEYYGVPLGLGQGYYPGDYLRLALDWPANWGFPPVISNGTWRQTNASRYVRKFRSRRSLLVWKIFGQRLDGWTNEDHPTESIPGDAGTLPAGADPNDADLDFNGLICPPPDSGVPPLTIDEKMTLARWIDLGCPLDLGSEGNQPYGWLLDELRPVVAISSPRPGANEGALDAIRMGLADAYTGLDLTTLSVTADVAISGQPEGAELAGLATEVGDGIHAIVIDPPISDVCNAHLTVAVADYQGNLTREVVEFSVECTENECDSGVPGCPGDANGDGLIDPLDVGFVQSRFGCDIGTGATDCCAADQNSDGWVDPLDSGFVQARFGACP